MAAGILIGLRDRVDRDLAAAFTTAGVSHVVAISGWNIAIVAAAVAAVAGGLGRRRRSLVTIVAIVAYVAFAGASASVVRAALMAGVVLLARESGRAGRAGAALGWAALLLLLADPSLVTDAGFQLSSLATAGLIAWGTPLTRGLESIARGRIPRWLAESLGVSLAAQAATLPIILASFGRLAILSPVVNLVVVPLVAPAMGAGLVALGGGALVLAGGPPIAGAILAAPGWVILRILVAVVETAAGLPFASVTLEPPSDLLAAVATAAAIGGALWWARHRPRSAVTRAPAAGEPSRPQNPPKIPQATRSSRTGMVHRAALLALLVSLAVAGAVVAERPTAMPRVSVLDVGQGDAILVEGSNGGRLLIDGGPDPDRLLVALDRRIPPWDRRIDAVILSHPHEDHVAGLPLLLARYRVDRVFEPGMRGPGPGYAAWLRLLTVRGAPSRLAIAAGDRLAVDEISLRVLWPIRGEVPVEPPDGGTGINNVSVVLLGQVGPRRFLLMGDVEEGIDPSLLADGLPHVDFLKVAHHGSRTATTEPFVETVRPAVAVASAGAGNPYGHPAASTLARLAAAGARVLRTDRDGTVVATFAADGMRVQTEGAAASWTGPALTGTALAVARAGGGSVAVQGSEATVEGGRRPAVARFLCAIPVTALVPERPRLVRRRLQPRGCPSARGRTREGPAPSCSAVRPTADRIHHPSRRSLRVARTSTARAGAGTGAVSRAISGRGPCRASGTIGVMTVPGRVEAASLLISLDPPPWFVRHSRAVGEVAGWLAARMEARGISVDRRLVESAALLHDADKALPADDPAKALRHGGGSAAWLTRMGHPELARAVANHPVTRLADDIAYGRWAVFATREEQLVAYADKRAAQRLEPMATRFGRWRRHHSRVVKEGHVEGWDESELRTIWLRAVRLERDVCRAAGIEPSDVSRLRWTGAALRAAREAELAPGAALRAARQAELSPGTVTGAPPPSDPADDEAPRIPRDAAR